VLVGLVVSLKECNYPNMGILELLQLEALIYYFTLLSKIILGFLLFFSFYSLYLDYRKKNITKSMIIQQLLTDCSMSLVLVLCAFGL
jgi:hypothetical protein